MACWLVSLLLLSTTSAAAERLTLEQAINLALDHSWSTQAAQADSARASQEYRAARAGRFPTLSLEARAFRVSDVITAEFPFQRIELGLYQNYQAEVRLNLPLYTGGKISSGIKMQAQTLQAATTELESKRLETAYQTRRAYLGLLLSEHLLAATQSSANRVGIIAGNVANLHDAGMADSIDLIEVATAEQQAAEAVNTRQMERDNAAARLAQLLGGDVIVKDASLDSLALPQAAANTPSPSEAEIVRPELRRLEDQIAVADAAVSFATAQYLPDLAAFAGYSVGQPNRDMFQKEWDDYFSIGAALTWSFNLGNKTGNERQAATEQVNALKLRRQQLQEAYLLQATTAAHSVTNARQTLASRARELELARNKYRLAQNQAAAGGLSVNRLLEIEAELSSAEQLWRAALVGYYLNRTEYDYALGAESIYGGIQ